MTWETAVFLVLQISHLGLITLRIFRRPRLPLCLNVIRAVFPSASTTRPTEDTLVMTPVIDHR